MFAVSVPGPGCVKTCASRECAELFSVLSPFYCDWQQCSFPIERNRDNISTRKFDVGVFTQPGSKTEVSRLAWHVRFYPSGANIVSLPRHVRMVPTTDHSSNHFCPRIARSKSEEISGRPSESPTYCSTPAAANHRALSRPHLVRVHGLDRVGALR
jgi:hypothetical protein